MTEDEWRADGDPDPLLRFADHRLTDRLRLLFMAGCCRRIWDLLRDARFRRLVEVAEARADGRATEDELQAAAGEIPVPGYLHARGGPAVGVLDFHELPAWCQHTHHAVGAVGRRDILVVADEAHLAAAYFAESRITDHHPLRHEIRRVCDEVRDAYDRAEEYRRRGATSLADRTAGDAGVAERESHHRVRILENTIWSAGAAERIDRAAQERAAQAALIRCLVGNPFRPAAVEPAWLTSSVVAITTGIEADQAFDRLPILADALQDAGCDHDDFLSHCRDERVHARGCWVVAALLGDGPRHNLPSA
jgi:hypothetical protein